jgi:transcription elongation factor GreB
MNELNYITPNGLKAIQDELIWLRRIERPRIVEEVAYAAALGDRSENAEYIYGKKRLRQIDSRTGFLMKCLNRTQVIDPVDVKGNRIHFGATVVLEGEDGVEKTWHIYGQHEVDVSKGIISHRSPLARALMGRGEGDGIVYQTPGGAREVEVVSVAYFAQVPLPEPDWKKDL